MSVPVIRMQTSSRADVCSGTWPVVPATARPPHGAPGEERARKACKRWTPEHGVAGRRDDERRAERHRSSATRTPSRTIRAHPVRLHPRSATTQTAAVHRAANSLAIVPRRRCPREVAELRRLPRIRSVHHLPTSNSWGNFAVGVVGLRGLPRYQQPHRLALGDSALRTR